jgi:hypothetical protein
VIWTLQEVTVHLEAKTDLHKVGRKIISLDLIIFSTNYLPPHFVKICLRLEVNCDFLKCPYHRVLLVDDVVYAVVITVVVAVVVAALL